MAEELEQDNPEIQDNSDELYERFSFKTDKGQEPLRIDKFLTNRIERATRNKLAASDQCRPGTGQWKRDTAQLQDKTDG